MACKLSDLAERTDSPYMDDKRAVSQDEFVLERVQGLTSTTLHSLASNPVTGWVAFPAACVLVLLDPKTNEQKFIESPSLRNISCCAFTDDGRFVAFGETGMKPHIAMWNLREHKECHKFVADTTVRAIFFHPSSPILISLGLKENVIVVWDYIKGMRMASCKWQTMPLSLTIPRVGSSLVVCGHRKITLFNISKVDSRSYETNVFEDRRTVLLGKQSEYTFVDIESGRGKHERTVYTVTSCGYLCEVKLGDILIDKAIKVDTQTFCVRYSTELLFVGCPAGLVKICDPDNLTVTAAVSLSNLLGPSAIPKVGNKGYIDVCTLVVDENEKIVTCVYADCSMHSWQIGTDGQKIVCSAIEPGAGTNGTSGHPVSKSNLLRAFIGCCEKNKGGMEFLNKFSMTEHSKPPMQYGGRRLVNENRASYNNVNAVRFTPDGKDVICGNEEGEIKVYELATGILRRVIEAHSSQVTCIELMYDDDFQLVCSGGRDRVMFVLNARTDFSLVQVLCDHSAAITAISLVNHKGVLTLVSAAADNVILIRRAILGGTLRFTITGEIAQTNCNRSFFVTSDYIALGGKDSQIKVFKADPVFVSKPLKTINCQKLCPSNAGFRAIDIDPSSSFMAVSQANGNISVYHLQTGQPVASLPLQSDINNIQFTDDLKYMVSSTSNGCDLVWRLPERMTDFMRSKQEKTYQIETNKEVTYETYMSCVKVCKEEDDDDESTDQHNNETRPRRGSAPGDGQTRGIKNNQQQQQQQQQDHRSHVAQNSSNHNSEWDQTPSIDSMSIIDHYNSHAFGSGKGDAGGLPGDAGYDKSRGCSTCGCESAISCNTCTHSVSTTTHTSCCSAAPSDSSLSTTDGHPRPGGKRLRFYCGADHKLFGQVIDETRCIKVGPFREAAQTVTAQPPPNTFSLDASGINDELSHGNNRRRFKDEANRQASLTAKMKTLAIEDEETEEQVGKNEEINKEETPKAALIHEATAKVERCFTEKIETLQIARGGEEASHKVQESKDKIEYKKDLSYLSDQKAQNISQNSDQSNILTPPLTESRFTRSKNVLEKAIFYESVMKSDLKSNCRTTVTSPTRQYTAAVKDAVRSVSRRKPSQPENTAPTGAGRLDTPRDAEEMNRASPHHWTPLTTPEYSNTSSDITNLVPSSSSTLVDMCSSGKLLQDLERPPLVDASLDRLARDCTRGEEDTRLVGCMEKKPTEKREKKLGSDTTQGDGESFQTEFDEDAQVGQAEQAQAQNDGTYTIEGREQIQERIPKIDILSDPTSAPVSLPNQVTDLDSLPTSIQDSTNDSSPVEPSIDNNALIASDEPIIQEEAISKQSEARTFVNQTLEQTIAKIRQDSKDQAEKPSVIEQLEKEGFAVPEKYHSALRSCMQLSNSQETFATLRVDTNDLELMAFLSHALKRKLVAAGLVGLSYDEIDKLIKSGVPPARVAALDNELASATGSASPTVPAFVPPPVLTLPLVQDTGLAEGVGDSLQNAPIESKEAAKGICENTVCPGDHLTVTGKVEKLDEINKVENDIVVTKVPDVSKEENNKEMGGTVSPQKSPDTKKGKYKAFLNKLSSARKRMTNRSANRSSTESELEEEPSLDSVMSESTLGECWMDTDQQKHHRELLHSDTYVRVESSDESQVFIMKNQLPANDGSHINVEHTSGNKLGHQDSVAIHSDPTSTKHQHASLKRTIATASPTSQQSPATQRCPSAGSRDASSNRRRGSSTTSRASPTRRLPVPSASTDVPSMPSSTSTASVSPRGSCLSEGRGLKELQGASLARSRKSSYAHTTWKSKVTGGGMCEQDSEESVKSRADSFVSSISKDMSTHQSSESDSGVDASSQRGDKPLAEIFRDQDEYLRRLKEVRENFERSIQALSEERKSRQAAEEIGSNLARP